MMQQKIFGAAGEEVVIEECMQGAEASVFVVTDGHAYKFLAAAQDHKPIYADDQGPNTGGMGAYAPTPLVDPSLLQTVERSIVQPTLQAMQNKGCPYQGVLYVGLMLTNQGPKVVEFNCRFGDPEAQILFPLIDSDLLEMLQATAQGKLADYDLQLNSNYATCVVIASGGYPGKYQKGLPIEISGKDTPDSYILQAGTALQNGQLITAGGRVLNAIGIDPDLKTSIAQAYERAQQVNFEGMYYRPDIGAKGLKYLVK
jgi:phosphoribosylamine--glycine ligase